MKKIYLAIPYTFNAELSYQIANEVAAAAMIAGHIVFSPISHGHSVAEFLDEKLRYDQKFWMKQCLPMVEWCDELHVISIGENGLKLIEESKGCQSELSIAKDHNKTIKIIEWPSSLE